MPVRAAGEEQAAAGAVEAAAEKPVLVPERGAQLVQLPPA